MQQHPKLSLQTAVLPRKHCDMLDKMTCRQSGQHKCAEIASASKNRHGMRCCQGECCTCPKSSL